MPFAALPEYIVDDTAELLMLIARSGKPHGNVVKTGNTDLLQRLWTEAWAVYT